MSLTFPILCGGLLLLALTPASASGEAAAARLYGASQSTSAESSDAAIERVRALVESGQLDEARKLAAELVAACDAAEVRLGVAARGQGDPLFEQIRRMIAADWLGGPIAVTAVCGDDELLRAAVKSGADTLVVGEIKHSQMLEALRVGLNVVAAGHYATEHVVCAPLLERLSAQFGEVAFSLSQADENPARFV